MHRSRRRIAASVAVGALLFGACGGSEAGSAPGDSTRPEAAGDSGGATVALANVKFQPGDISIARGEEVTWTNEDTVLHTVTSGKGHEQGVPGVSENTDARPDGLFDNEMPEGERFSFTFEEAGTFEYFCAIHPGMTGTVTVE